MLTAKFWRVHYNFKKQKNNNKLQSLVYDMVAARKTIREYNGITWWERQIILHRYTKLERDLFKKYRYET